MGSLCVVGEMGPGNLWGAPWKVHLVYSVAEGIGETRIRGDRDGTAWKGGGSQPSQSVSWKKEATAPKSAGRTIGQPGTQLAACHRKPNQMA